MAVQSELAVAAEATSSSSQKNLEKYNALHSIGKNTLFGIVASVFQIGTRFVTVPLVISHLGLGGYGIWSIIMTAASYMRFGSVGLKSAFQKYVAEATGNGNYEHANQLLSTGSAAMLVLSLIGSGPIAIFSGPLAKMAGVPPEFLGSAARSLSVLGLTMVIANAGAAYEAIVSGCQRIDLARKFNTCLCVLEAGAIIAALKIGWGLLAMTVIMAASELVFVGCCAVACRRVAPEFKLLPKYISPAVWKELTRYAGSYQMVSVLQIIYGAIVPVATLRMFGANAAGVIALANRLVSPVTMCQSAFLVPILSSGAMIYASGAIDRMQALVVKSVRIMLGATFLPLALVSAFGSYLIKAWTNESDPRFLAVLVLTSVATVFSGLALLGLVLYRASGRALTDNIRELSRIFIIVLVTLGAARLGLYGVLGGVALAELIGMIIMIFAIAKILPGFHPAVLLPTTVKMIAATAATTVFAAIAAGVVPDIVANARTEAAIRLGIAGLIVLVFGYPIFRAFGAIDKSEALAIVSVIKKRAR